MNDAKSRREYLRAKFKYLNDAKSRREYLRAKLEYLNDIEPYLLELGTLTNKTVNRCDLSSIEEVEEVRARLISGLKNSPTKSFEINFSEKEGVRFDAYVQSLYNSNREAVYIWTKGTNSCGLYKVDSMKSVNFSFPFEINNDEMLVFLSVDVKDRLLLDYFIDDAGDKIIEVRVRGLNWINVEY